MLSLITGVGKKGQVGEAVASALGHRGDTVIVVSRSEAEVQERAREVAASGVKTAGYACDLADAQAVSRLAERVRSDHGERLDALVNLAGGFGLSGPLAKSDPQAAAQQFSINFTTAYLATRAFLPMLERARGSIVFFASESALERAASQHMLRPRRRSSPSCGRSPTSSATKVSAQMRSPRRRFVPPATRPRWAHKLATSSVRTSPPR